MKVRTIGLGIVLAGFTLASAAPAIAQSDPRGGGGPPGGGASERTGGGGASTSSGTVGGGGGVATGGGGGGGGVSSGSSGSGSGGFNSPSMGSATSSNLSSIDRGTRATAPERRAGFSASSSSQDSQKANPRTAAGSGSGERAVPRGTASGGSSSGSGGDNANSGRTRTPRGEASGGNNASGTREVPQWSRPRGDRPATGVAVDRVGPPPDRDRDRDRGRYGYYDPYYYGGGYGYGGFGYGGYGYGSCGIGCTFSPYYMPYGFGMGYGLYSGLGWNPYYGDPMDSYSGGSGGYSSGLYNTRDQGNLKLKVKPRAAKVYVDGYFVGTVDQFDGAFQKLALNGGRHKVEVRADGFETAEFDVLITPSQTITFQGELKRIQ